MTEYEFYLALRTRYNAKEYALMPQVRNGTGFKKSPRTADAIAVSLWPSRGIWAHGFEFKDSRTDWLKELKQPEKADEIGKHCAYWSVVVSDKEIVKESELPPLWGLLLATDKGSVKTIKDAPHREAKPADWLFVAAVLRAAVEVVTDEAAIQKRVDEARWKAKDEWQKYYDEQSARLKKTNDEQLESLRGKINEFEKASGVRIETWRHSYGENTKIGEAVNLIIRGGLQKEIQAFQAAVQRIADMQKVADELKSLTS